MSKKRDDFLEKQWRRYPEMPQRALRWGRIQQHYLGTQTLSALMLISGHEDTFEIAADEVLRDGDLVCLMPGNKVLLLAPNLTSRDAKSILWPDQKHWQSFQSEVRKIFLEKSFQEIRTPTLVQCPGTEPTLDPFLTELKIGSKSTSYYLPTSPELNLKKLLVEGAEKIFELAPVFRNGELTDRHRAEFVMLEWYRAFANLAKIKMDVIELFERLAETLKVQKPLGVLNYSVTDLFKQHCQFDLTPQTTAEELKVLADQLGVDVSAAASIDDYFFLIFMEKIEFKWSADHIVFVEKYPPYQAALARVGKDGWAERFEVYWKGLEIGNAFHELNDPVMQRQRSQEDLNKKIEMGKLVVSLDDKFFSALDFGMPPSAGIAIGMERLYMALTGLKDISALSQPY